MSKRSRQPTTLTIEQARDAYYTYTSSLSASVEKFSLAAIAVSWLLATDGRPTVTAARLTDGLRWSMLLAITALAAGFLQYVVQSATWGLFQWRKEIQIQNGTANAEFLAPRAFNYVPVVFYVVKVMAAIGAYIALAIEISSRGLVH